MSVILMLKLPVVAVLRSLFNLSPFFLVILPLWSRYILACCVFAVSVSPANADSQGPVVITSEPLPRYVARIELNTAEELMAVLTRSELLFTEGGHRQGESVPVAIILHGPEARVFMAEKYNNNQVLVDLAAKLTALEVVKISVCKRWIGSNGLDESKLLPFVETVLSGPDEKARLVANEGYTYF